MTSPTTTSMTPATPTHAAKAAVTPASVTSAMLAELVYLEARLLDDARWDDWLALFAADGLYWLPLSRSIVDPRAGQSLTAEDRLLLAVRVARLKARKAPSLQPMPVCQHVLQAPHVEAADAAGNRWTTRTPFLYTEIRATETTLLAGTATHRLRVEDGTLRIVEKRVDLANAGGPVPAVFLMP